MQSMELCFVVAAFLLIGVVVGYVTFLIFRISVHQEKFSWPGALSVITSLAGGGFLSYWSREGNFAAYGLGFFLGFAFYWCLLQRQAKGDDDEARFFMSKNPVRGSNAVSKNPVSGSNAASGRAGNENAAPVRRSRKNDPGFGHRNLEGLGDDPQSAILSKSSRSRLPIDQRPESDRPEDPKELIKVIVDVGAPAARRVKALLALGTGFNSDAIDVEDSLHDELKVKDLDILFYSAVLMIPFRSRSGFPALNEVGDLISFVEGDTPPAEV
jgi:hypothetical protein